jgi:hypothetical protein
MPFVVNKKWGITYCYMPMFVQQFAVYGLKEKYSLLVEFLRSKYKYAELCLPQRKELNHTTLGIQPKTNFVLTLNSTYAALYSGYSKKHQASISKYKKNELTYTEANDILPLLDIFRKEKADVFSGSQMKVLLENIDRIYTAAKLKGVSKLYYATGDGQIVGGAFFLISETRIYYFFATSKKEESKFSGVSFGLLDYIIKEYAQSSYVLDFEGSDNTGIAHFFKGFGARNEPYSFIKWNDLPFFIKWIKR